MHPHPPVPASQPSPKPVCLVHSDGRRAVAILLQRRDSFFAIRGKLYRLARPCLLTAKNCGPSRVRERSRRVRHDRRPDDARNPPARCRPVRRRSPARSAGWPHRRARFGRRQRRPCRAPAATLQRHRRRASDSRRPISLHPRPLSRQAQQSDRASRRNQRQPALSARAHTRSPRLQPWRRAPRQNDRTHVRTVGTASPVSAANNSSVPAS